jgi:hypothetical protein
VVVPVLFHGAHGGTNKYCSPLFLCSSDYNVFLVPV